MKNILDLRFIIGAFFAVVGIVLIGYALISRSADGHQMNMYGGAVYLVFGLLMLILWFFFPSRIQE
ncbi:MAG: hypothetical protein K6T34_09580 [Thermoflavifilum sp.]|nr:hypothetical protein [Thermoflavifilum sp.]